MFSAGGGNGPTIAVHGWATWIITAGSVVLAAGAIWKVVWPIVRAAVKVNEALPTLIQIGEDFRRNHGSSLRDRIENIDDNVDTLGTVTIDGKPQPLATVLAELHRYAHENNHTLKGRMDVVEGWQKLYDGLIAKIPDPAPPEPPAEPPPT